MSQKLCRALAFFAASVAVGLGACGTGSSSGLTFATWGSVEEVALLKPLIERFNQAHPETPVTLLHIPDGYFQKLHLLFAAGQAPDVVFLNNWQLPAYAASGQLHDLTPRLAASTALKATDFFPASLEASRYKGTLYAIPRDVSNLVVYVNLDRFAAKGVEPPKLDWGWEDLRRIGPTFVEDSDGDGRIDHWAISADPRPLFYLPFVWSAGGDLLSSDLSRFTLDSPEARLGLETFRQLRDDWHLAPRETETGGAAMGQLFAQGKLAMFVSGRWSVPAFRETLGFRWDIRPFPQGPAGSIVDADSSGWAIAKGTRHPEAAWRFIEHLAGAEASQAFTSGGLIIPARPDIAHSADFLQPGKPPAHARVFLDVLETARPLRTPPTWGELNGELEQNLGPVWQGRRSLDEGLAGLKQRAEGLL